MNKNARYYLSLLALGMGGSTIWLLMYIRYVFYDPMLEALGCTNAQLGALLTRPLRRNRSRSGRAAFAAG